ncbi:MAG: DUF1549 domain-containing protein [Rubripirellula sp.]|nr:DUF1549 domain-containing protein [Rubripirellula sp.]
MFELNVMRYRVFAFLLLSLACVRMVAAQSVTSMQPRSIRPGETTEVTVQGKALQDCKRALLSVPAKVELISTAADKTTLAITLPKDTPLGPIGMWMVGKASTAEPVVLLVDDLPAVAEQPQNHSQQTAQPIDPLTAVNGVSDGSKSDFFCFQVASNQRVAFEVLTQSLRSTMDPMVRLLNEDGETLRVVDDDEVGPECRFSHTFEVAGKVWLEVRDNRYASGGIYQLRVGDFPIVRHAFPMAIQRGTQASVQLCTLDGLPAVRQQVSVPEGDLNPTRTISGRLENGQSASWCRIALVDSDQHLETQVESDPLSLPIDLNGRLASQGEQDEYVLRGVKATTFRFAGKTRSLGSRALLQMQLVDEAGATVAQSSVNDADEWAFDYRFPDAAEYRLRVSDLLERGGVGFGYFVQVTKSPGFRLAWKGDAKTSERYVMDEGLGACAIELQVHRFGYEGEIELSSASPTIRILNPVIPAKAKVAKIHLAVGKSWTADSASLIQLVGRAKDDANLRSRLTSFELHRLKRPHVLSPAAWQDGMVLLSGGVPGDSYYKLEPTAALQFTVGTRSHVVDLKLTRVNAGFKGSVSLMRDQLPAEWTLKSKAEKDLYQATLDCSDPNSRPSTLSIAAYSEFKGRGRLSRIDLPVQWIEPVQVQFKSAQPFIAGHEYQLIANVHREGNDPQPATLRLTQYPEGWSGPESIEIPADATQVEVAVSIATTGSESRAFQYEVTGNYHGQEFKTSAQWLAPTVIPLPERWEVYPSKMVLTAQDPQRQLVITGWDESGVPRDWTRDVKFATDDPAIVDFADAVVQAKANGDTIIQVSLGDRVLNVPVSVRDMETKKLASFESEVLVALSKQGCNSGACHGSPSGKGMFRLSLRAFDKQLDELTLIREDFGRRVNRIDPEQSLLLLKPLMKVNHGGGKQLNESDAAYAILRDWVAAGARADPPGSARCTSLNVFPSDKRVMSLTGGGQQLSVTAHFSDGSDRDVTDLCAYESSNTGVALVDPQGLVRPQARGEAVILVRFLEHIVSVPLLFIDTDPGFQFAAPPPHNYIDEFVDAKLRQLQYLPSANSTDGEFLRRVYLDVIGILPTHQETKLFLEDQNPGKRAQLIDALLERPEFAKFWALKWGDLLKMTGKMVGDEGVHKYHRWVMEAFRNNLPYDQFARALLAGEGSTLANPPANFYRTATDMNECVETVSQVFLGARLQCAKCHNHPFERWTQDNYYGLAAFFNRLQRRKTGRPGEMFVYSAVSGEVTQPRTGKTMQPWLPVKGEVSVPVDQDRRDILLDWLVQPGNPYFARIEANRIWSELFARGIVDPIDDFRDSNPPTNGPLLDALAKDFVAHGFDRKHLLRTILNSRTYQASYVVNDSNRDDTDYFSHQRPRLLSAEQLLDAVNHIMGLQQTFGNLPAGTKATHLPAPDLVKVDFLKVFGQPERSTVCACERVDDSNLAMAIELFNGSTIHKKLSDPKNRMRLAVAAGESVESIVGELYLSALSRYPSELELNVAVEHVKKRDDLAKGLEDVCWALMNTDEFLFQH